MSKVAEILVPSGRLDCNNSSALEPEVIDKLGEVSHGMVCDVAGLYYMSSAGLRVILLASKLDFMEFSGRRRRRL